MTNITAMQFTPARPRIALKKPSLTLEEMIDACGVGYFSLTHPKHWEAHYRDQTINCTGAGASPYNAVEDLLRALAKEQPNG
jgi:hypothetical protein